MDYCKKIWEGIDLSHLFCMFSTLTPPSTELIDLLSTTFKYIYWDFDICTLSERQRKKLFSLGLVKPQPTDEEILDFMSRCEKYNNIEVRLNLISGLPYFALTDLEAEEQLLSKMMNNYSCFGELHWARLHAQPGAPIIETAEKHDMHSFAITFQDFLEYSKKNFDSQTSHQHSRLEHLNYPYIYFNDDALNSKITLHYSEINKKIRQHQENRRTDQVPIETFTYRQLDQKANQLARSLREKGVRVDSITAVMLEPSLEIPLAILSVLKAGGGYLPIDPTLPAQRISTMLEDSQTSILLSQSGIIQKTAEQISRDNRARALILLDDRNGLLAKKSSETLETISQPANNAYVIYTSGSTGKPKGVLLWSIMFIGSQQRQILREMIEP
ncbi:AMP-binding protein [Acidobacteriota bacterium]